MEEIPAGGRSTIRLTAREASEARPSPSEAGPTETRERPFCIAVFGDLTGRGVREPATPTAREWSATRATPDNVPQLAGLRPSLELRLGREGREVVHVDLAGLDDFHPDVLFRGHPLFGELRDARRAVREGRDPGIELEATPAPSEPRQGEGKPDGEPAPSSPGARRRASGEGLLDEVVDRTASSARDGERDASPDEEVLAFAREVVRPHLVRPEPDRSADLAAVDRAASELMRRVLHAGPFQALEGLWRALVFLLSRIDTTGKVRVYLVDVSRGELEGDLARADDPADTRLARILTRPESAGGPSRWALAVGAYAFGPEDAALFRRIGRAARAADVPWVSGATSRLAGLEPAAGSEKGEKREADEAGALWPDDWTTLREAPEARWLGLAFPGFLLREPWGSENARPCRTFSFREEPEDGAAEPAGRRPLLWGNPAFLVAAVVARAFAREGWGLSTDSARDLLQIPLTPARGGDRAATLTEVPLRPSTATRLIDAGFIGVVGFPREARLRVAGIRPILRGSRRVGAWWCRR